MFYGLINISGFTMANERNNEWYKPKIYVTVSVNTEMFVLFELLYILVMFRNTVFFNFVRYSRNQKTQRFGNWIHLLPQVKREDI
jgi:hypothetical protein